MLQKQIYKYLKQENVYQVCLTDFQRDDWLEVLVFKFIFVFRAGWLVFQRPSTSILGILVRPRSVSLVFRVLVFLRNHIYVLHIRLKRISDLVLDLNIIINHKISFQTSHFLQFIILVFLFAFVFTQLFRTIFYTFFCPVRSSLDLYVS